MPITLPKWLDDLPEAERPAARTKFLLKYCALYATENGSLQDLSEALGYSRRTILQTSGGFEALNTNIALRIEKLLGREVITRELLLPEIFDIPA